MEYLQEVHLNQPMDDWKPWQADEELYFLIITGQISPQKMDEAPVVAAARASESLQLVA